MSLSEGVLNRLIAHYRTAFEKRVNAETDENFARESFDLATTRLRRARDEEETAKTALLMGAAGVSAQSRPST
jgi:hypothetical protein